MLPKIGDGTCELATSLLVGSFVPYKLSTNETPVLSNNALVGDCGDIGRLIPLFKSGDGTGNPRAGGSELLDEASADPALPNVCSVNAVVGLTGATEAERPMVGGAGEEIVSGDGVGATSTWTHPGVTFGGVVAFGVSVGVEMSTWRVGRG